MKIPISSPVPILTLAELKMAVEKQRSRGEKLRKLIESAQQSIDIIRREAARTPQGVDASAAAQIKAIQERSAAPRIITIREETDKEVVPILREMVSASDDAAFRAERHYDKFSILRRAVKGAGSESAAPSLRLSYNAILQRAGVVELARFAQQAVDTVDHVLADAVLRENSSRKTGDRPFSSDEFLAQLEMPEFDEAHLSLKAVMSLAAEAGQLWSEFETGRPNTLARISAGLAARRESQRAAAAAGGR